MLASLIPIRDWLYGALIVGLICFGLYERSHLISEGETHELAAVAAASDKAERIAQTRVDTLNKAHTDTVAQIVEKASEQHAQDSAQHDADARRLRDIDANRQAAAGVQGSAAGPQSASGGIGGPVTDDGRFESLEQVALGLADGNRAGLDALNTCRAERADLVGK